jgi:hypothetical protein
MVNHDYLIKDLQFTCSQTSPSRMVDHDYLIKDIQFTCSHTCLSGMAEIR